MGTSNYLLYCTTTLIISLSLFYAYAKYKLSYWKRRGVKTPPTHIIFGNFKDSLTFKKQPAQVLNEIYRNADLDDPYIGFYIFHKPMLLLRDYEMIKYVMRKHFDVFPNRKFGGAAGRDIMGLTNLLSVHSQPIWKYLKSKLSPALSERNLKNMIPLIIKCEKPMLDYIERLPTDKTGLKTVEDIYIDISACYITNVLFSIFFGVDINSFDKKDNAFVQAGFNIFRGFKSGIVLMIYFLIPEWIPVIEPFATGIVKFFRKCFCDSINNRERMKSSRGDLLDFLLMLKNGKQNPIFKLEGDNLLGQVTSFYLGAFEAIGTSSAFIISQLARHPKYQTALYDEIQMHLEGKEFNVEMINEMSFLDCIVNEGLRLLSPLPILDRIAEKNIELPGTGLVIEKGTSVYVSTNSMNQDAKYFPNPLEFNPLRINMENKKFYELTFGIGPRACIGQRLALLILKILIITIVSNYILSDDMKTKKNVSNITIFSYATDSHVQFKNRNKSV